MNFPWAQIDEPGHGISPPERTPLIRYGIGAIILVSLAVACLHFIPLIHRDLRLLHDVYTLDVKGMALEGDLQYEIQESRRRFLRILLAAHNPQEMQQEIRLMQRYDATVAVTVVQLSQLGVIPELQESQFRASWNRYQTVRDRMVDKIQSGHGSEVRAIDYDLGNGIFDPVEQAVHASQASFEATAASHLAEVSGTLKREVVEVLVVVVAKICALILLIWIDWRRARAESQLRKATRSLKASEDRFQLAYESATVGMGIFKLDGTIVSCNRMAAQMLGYEVNELIGTKIVNFIAPEDHEDHLNTIASLPASSAKSYHAERRVLRKDGRSAWVSNSVTLLQSDDNEPYYFSISQDITEQKEANDRIVFLANYDPVTSLPNRHYFEQHLIETMKALAHPAALSSEGLALLYVEIDSFDFLKGTFGNTVADEILTELGSSLSAFLREGELIARIDDHVFALLLPAPPYDEQALIRASELKELLHRAGEIGRHRIPLAASIGVAYSETVLDPSGTGRIGRLQAIAAAPLPGTLPDADPLQTAIPDHIDFTAQAESLVKFARAAMLEARSRGGDSLYLADPGLQQRAVERHKIELALLRGLREDEFRVVYQPQFAVATGSLVRFEALCRWTSAELGPIPPDRFIPIAEQTGLIMEIGRRVLSEALQHAKSWTDSGRRIGVAVNISPMQFMRPDFVDIVTEVLAVTQFPPALLELEITEGIFIRDLNLAVARIRELQRLGLSIALDDFGTGYSSLSYLQRMPIDAVKLDRSFVSDITTDVATVSMVRSVLAMAEALHLRVVTEGVETQQQLDILKALGCDEAQGYLLGRPESADQALQRVIESPVLPPSVQSITSIV